MSSPLRLGVSTCLLGKNVRYNGGHTLDRWVVNELGKYVEYVPVCPEVECGLGIPREAMRLVGSPQSPRLVTRQTGVDHTEKMLTWTAKRLEQLAGEDLCGYVFKSKSPSSGMARVKVYNEKGQPAGHTSGLFAGAFMKRFPLLPAEEEGRLHDEHIRENFIERVFTMKRWRDELETPTASLKDLVGFHTRHKLLVLAHSQKHYREMGKLVAHAQKQPFERIKNIYLQQLVEALQLRATPAKHVNTMQHAIGYFKRMLTAGEKQEYQDILQHFRLGNLPLIVPVTLLNHYVRKYENNYLADQWYLNPHPVELKLRNHA